MTVCYSEKSKTTVFILWFFFGALSAHRFYTGKPITALLQIFTFGGLGIWLLIDGIMILINGFTDEKGLLITEWK